MAVSPPVLPPCLAIWQGTDLAGLTALHVFRVGTPSSCGRVPVVQLYQFDMSCGSVTLCDLFPCSGLQQ